MYDRKTWIVVVACSILLAVNIHFQQKNRLLEAEQQRAKAQQVASQPAVPVTPDGAAAAPKPGTLTEVEPPVQTVEQLTTLETPETTFTFTTVGGGLKYSEFRNQTPGVEGPVRINRHGSKAIGAFVNAAGSIDADSYEILKEESVEGKSVVFRGKLASGVWAKKTWSLLETGNEGAPYMLDLKVQLENAGQGPVSLDSFSLFLGTSAPLDTTERADQTGFVVNNDSHFTFHSSTEFAKAWFGMKKERTTITVPLEKATYAGVANQFFASVLKPMEPGAALVWSKVAHITLTPEAKPLTTIDAGLNLPAAVLSPGDQRTLTYQLFTGPKQNRVLRKMGDDWGDLMNYGYFSWVSRSMNTSLWWVHAGMDKISGKWSWGLAVIVLTILLRTAIWPLYNRSNRTMKRMAKLKPEMEKLKEKYPDDPQKMQQETMKMYRTYGINPLGGCLPMFAQLPIFFGFYAMLLHAVEMRGQTFLWVTDLSQPDTVFTIGGIPINPLPIVMAITSFAQMAMMPNTGGDKTQMMVIKFMPFMFLFICYNFASALALYWTTSNIFSIGQTWLSNRMPEPALNAKAVSGKSWMEKMTERAAEQQKMRQASGRVIDPKDEPSPGKKRPPRTGG